MNDADPTRISPLMAQLARVWEGQPDLTFGALLGAIAQRVDWTASDADFAAILAMSCSAWLQIAWISGCIRFGAYG